MQFNRKWYQVSNGGGGGKAPAAPAPAAPAPPPPPTEDTGPDPAMQAEIEKQRGIRFAAGKLGTDEDTTGAGTTVNEEANKTTLLGG